MLYKSHQKHMIRGDYETPAGRGKEAFRGGNKYVGMAVTYGSDI